MNEGNIEGIDYENRRVELPADAVEAMKIYPGLEDFFNSMSFSHKKEYIEAIVSAVKPETRHRRITQMIEMVNELRSAQHRRRYEL